MTKTTEINDRLEINSDLETALVALFESAAQADYDFCGEQRDWHLPRLQKAMRIFLVLFPHHSVKALQNVKTPYDP